MNFTCASFEFMKVIYKNVYLSKIEYFIVMYIHLLVFVFLSVSSRWVKSAIWEKVVKTKYFNLTNYAVGSGNVLIRKQIEDRQVNDKYLAFCKFCYEVLGYNFEHLKFFYLELHK